MKENTTNSQQEISLEPTGRLVENAEEIAEVSKTAKKYIFCVTYEAAEKAALLSEMEALGVEILSQSDLDSTVTVRICMAQLAAIKSLNCIEKVETVADHEAVSSVETYMLQSTDNDGMMSMQALASEPMAAYSSCCPNTIGTAVTLPLEIWRTGCICCPCAETWYRFTPSVTGYHTIHTEGILDTMGSLYDANGCQLSSNDDGGADLNFKIVYYLTANRTYYVRVKAYGNNTGTFRIAVQNKVYVESVTVNNANVALDKGQSVTLSATVSPAFATDKTIRWLSTNTSVATVDVATGEVTAVGGGTAQVCAYAQDGSGKKGCCNVEVKAYVESVTVDTATRVMHVGTSAQFTATVLPADATNKLLRWSSSKEKVATVDAATGVVTAKAEGTTDIYATAQDGTDEKGICALTVEPPIHVEGITMCCCTHTMNVGETGYLSYDIYPADATDQSITWCSSNPDVVRIDVATGKMTAVCAGTSLITATTNDGSFVASACIYVNKTKIYQAAKTFRYDENGCLPEDLKYNDISVTDLKAMKWINWTDFLQTDAASFRRSWEDMCTLLFATEPLESVILDMIGHFMAGSGVDYLNDTLTEKVLEHSETQDYIASVKDCIDQLLKKYNGDIMQLHYIVAERKTNPLVSLLKDMRISEPSYDTPNDKLTGLTICIDSLWGNQIEVKSYSKLGNSYSGILSFTLYDHFGLDAADVAKYGLLAGFRAWYILQHSKEYNGAYKPFVTMIHFDVPFSGTIS